MNFRISILLLFLNFLCYSFSEAQSGAELDNLLSYLKDNSENQVLLRLKAYSLIEHKNEKSAIATLDALEKKINNQSPEILTRFKAIKARLLFYKIAAGDTLYAATMKSALKESYGYDNQFMIAEYSRWYGEMTNSIGNLQEAIQYCAFAVKSQELLGTQYFPSFGSFNLNLGELLYKSSNDREAKYYFEKGIRYSSKEKISAGQLGFAYNSLAMAYRNLSIFDTALMYCIKGMQFAKENGLEDIYYACSDNRFDPYIELGQVDSCQVIADNLYKYSVENKDNYYLAAAYYMKGRIDYSRALYKEGILFLKKSASLYDSIHASKNNIQVYKFLAVSYKAIGDSNNSKLYYQKFLGMKKDQDLRKQTINGTFLLAKADFEQEQLKFKKLYQLKERDIKVRNIGIACLLLISLAAAWWINKKRNEALHIKESTEEKLKDLSSEFDQKNVQIYHLTQQLENKELDVEKLAIVEQLKVKTILTNEDWDNFQNLFRQVYPSFLFKLKEEFIGITEAELRMAVLMKIQLNTKQIASLLGISPDSVHKTRQRLRQRMEVSDTTELENAIHNLE